MIKLSNSLKYARFGKIGKFTGRPSTLNLISDQHAYLDVTTSNLGICDLSVGVKTPYMYTVWYLKGTNMKVFLLYIPMLTIYFK